MFGVYREKTTLIFLRPKRPLFYFLFFIFPRPIYYYLYIVYFSFFLSRRNSDSGSLRILFPLSPLRYSIVALYTHTGYHAWYLVWYQAVLSVGLTLIGTAVLRTLS